MQTTNNTPEYRYLLCKAENGRLIISTSYDTLLDAMHEYITLTSNTDYLDKIHITLTDLANSRVICQYHCQSGKTINIT